MLDWKLPPDFESDLRTIANRLYSNHAVVMVGAGFSRNACPNYPTWEDLGNLFYSELHPGRQSPGGHYENILNLADEVASSKGRIVLEELVQSRIGSESAKPSDLHKRLLSLPWVDVFTTNYDTLLESTLPILISRRYSVVVSSSQLPYAKTPRIVKLHGSFPSSKPYILTSEDYRRYPETHSAFVNTVRQAFLEHTFCLIGFSGDDPNFLAWSGWLRDNLGDYSSPIYLICMDEPSESRRHLLAKRNIRPVPLSNFSLGCSKGFSAGLTEFFKYIERYKKKPNQWMNTSRILRNGGAEMVDDSIIEKWRIERESYNGGLVVPSYQREVLYLDLDCQALLGKSLLRKQDYIKATQFCYEYLWRLDLALKPIPYHVRYTLRGVLLHWHREMRKGTVDFDHRILYSLCIYLMRDCRVNGRVAEWKRIVALLEPYLQSSSDPIRDELQYERALFAESQFDTDGLANVLENWEPSENNPLAIVRTGLMHYMLGDNPAARKYFEKALLAVRRKSAYGDDYAALQLESVIIKDHLYITSFDPEASAAENERRADLQGRLTEIRGHGCDIGDELLYFESLFKATPVDAYSKESKVSYDLGSDQVTCSYHRIVDDGNSFLRLCERIAVPVTYIDKKSLETALKNVVSERVDAVLPILRYLGNEDLIKSVVTRESLLGATPSLIKLAVECTINDLRRMITSGSALRNENTFKALIQIASRLMCCNLPRETRERAYDCVKEIFENTKRLPPFLNINDFVFRLVRSTPIDEMPAVVKILTNLPCPIVNKDSLSFCFYYNPAYALLATLSERNRNGAVKSAFAGVSIEDAEWKRIVFQLESNDDQVYAWSLAVALLYQSLGLLSDEQIDKLRSCVRVEKDCKFSVRLGDFLDSTLFALFDSDEHGLKQWYLDRNLNGDWFASNMSSSGISITHGHSDKISNLVKACEKFESSLSVDETDRMLIRIESEWDVCKSLISKNDFGSEKNFIFDASLTEEGFERSYTLCRLISALAKIPSFDVHQSRVQRLVQDFAREDAPCKRMLASLHEEQESELQKLTDPVVFAMRADMEIVQRDARFALIELLGSKYEAVRGGALNVALSAMSWSDSSDASFIRDIVRQASEKSLMSVEFVACVYNMAARWMNEFVRSIRNHTEDRNVVRDVVHLGQIMELVANSGLLNAYRKSALRDMYDTMAAQLPFFEVREAWEFVGSLSC